MDLKLVLLAVALALIGGAFAAKKSPTEELRKVAAVKFTDNSPAGMERQVQKLISQIKSAIARNDDTVVVLSNSSRKIHIKMKGIRRRNREIKAKFPKSKIVASLVLDPSYSKKRNQRNVNNLFRNLNLRKAKTLIIIETGARVLKKH